MKYFDYGIGEFPNIDKKYPAYCFYIPQGFDEADIRQKNHQT